MEVYTLSMLVKNRAGVLTRVAGLIARRGFNIDSLSVCATEDEHFSRMSVELHCELPLLEQLRKQLQKQDEVEKIIQLSPAESVLRELLLVKISCTYDRLPEITNLANIFKAKIIDISDNSVILELTARKAKVDSFLEILGSYGIFEMARSGVSALQRGTHCIKDIKDN